MTKKKTTNKKVLEGGTAHFWGDDIKDDDEWAKKANEILNKKKALKSLFDTIKKQDNTEDELS